MRQDAKTGGDGWRSGLSRSDGEPDRVMKWQVGAAQREEGGELKMGGAVRDIGAEGG